MDTSAEAIYSHLLFHRAIIDEGDRSEKIERYMHLLKQAEQGEQVAPLDPVDRAIQLVFELVLANDFDPWDVNLMEFTRLYAKKMHADEVNFIVAGKLMYMAWSIFRLQSQEVLTLHEEPEAYELLCADWDMEHIDQLAPDGLAERINTAIPARVELVEAVRHHSTRPVSLVELLDAFDEAQREVEAHQQRERLRDELLKRQVRFDGKAHSEDLEKDVELTWARILRGGHGAIALEDILEGGREDIITIFVSLLFLARAGKISLWQDDLPYGQIFLEMRIPFDIGKLEDSSSAMVPLVENRTVI